MAPYTQAGRPMRVDTALEEDILLLERFSGFEAVSSPFSYEVDLLSRDDAIDPDDVLRTPMLLTVQGVADEPRLIHGMVSRFLQLGQAERLTAYRAHVVPWVWFLTLRKDCRIYQDMSVLEIVEQVFQSQGYSDFEIRCARDYPKREYCVQYRESNLDFVSRLLEHEGIYYFFEHTEDGHLLVLADDNSLIQPCPGQESARMAPEPVPDEDVVTLLRREHAVSAGTMTLTDYDPLQPSLDLLSSISGTEVEEVYDYPGDYVDLERGEWYARIRLEEEEARRHLVHGESTCRLFRSGYKFRLEGHYRRDTNQDYVLLEVSHSARAGDYRSWDSATLDYTNTFAALPLSVPYRPPRRTRKPVVKGAQTAVVVGKSGEEVWVDRHGRVKIQFHWDREGQRDENSSCWVRVATPWGGKGYGGVSIPRIGNEVIVDFLEGDPDRPIITGSVYNAEQTPPFALPDAGIQMGMKSRSSPGGGGSNEITMTDTKGEELVNIHAQYDMTTTVENDQTVTVNSGNRTMSVKSGTLSDTVKGDATLTIQAGSRTVSVTGGDYSATASDAVVIHGKGKGVGITGDSKGVGITGNGEGVGIEGNGGGVGIVGNGKGVGIEGNGDGVGIVGNGKGVGIKGNPDFFAEGTSSAGIKAPVVDIGDQEVNITGTKITISAGASTIVLDPGGVTIQGPLVKIN